MKVIKISLLLVSIIALSAASSMAQAPAVPPQGVEQQGQPLPPPPVTVLSLTPNVYWDNVGGFGAFIVGDKGVIVIDTGESPAAGKRLLEAIAKVTPKPVTTVILTHGDGDHVMGLPAFPLGIQIIAQENANKYLEATNAARCLGSPYSSDTNCPIIPAEHMPNHIVKYRENLTIYGEKIQLIYWGPAHTAGDMVIYLPVERIVLAGDLIVLDRNNLPFIHSEKGGSSKGWVTAVQGMLALDASLYVVGHQALGVSAPPVVIRDVIEKQLQAAIAEREKVKELYDKGESLVQVEAEFGDPGRPSQNTASASAQGPSASNASTPSQTGGNPSAAAGPPKFRRWHPPFSEVIYQELKEGTY